MSLDALLGAADRLRAPHESIALTIAATGSMHRVKVVVGREIQALVSAPTRAEAITKALAELGR